MRSGESEARLTPYPQRALPSAAGRARRGPGEPLLPGAGTGTASHGSWLIKVFCLRILLAVN